jgi:hypothetical protein
LFVFCTASFKEKLTTRKYIDGETTREGKHLTGEQVCRAQHFDPTYGFDQAWGFDKGTKALSILDFERLHIGE